MRLFAKKQILSKTVKDKEANGQMVRSRQKLSENQILSGTEMEKKMETDR